MKLQTIAVELRLAARQLNTDRRLRDDSLPEHYPSALLDEAAAIVENVIRLTSPVEFDRTKRYDF